MKIATWNVNGVRARQAQLQEWLHLERPEILCLQEIKASPEQIPAALLELEEYWSCWHGQKGYSGVGLHVRRDLAPERPSFGHPDFDFECRLASVDLGDLTVLSCYVPNGGKDFFAKMRFLADLEAHLGRLLESGRQVLLCGDLNVTRTDLDVHPRERKKSAIGQLPEERQALEAVLATGLVDLTRLLHPDDEQLFTWWPPWRNMRERNIGWRIDYILASSDLAARTRECRCQRGFGTSDHGPLVAVLD
jgi:exodeoxyribonuclease-3